jgi:hypothetical protein
MTDKQCKKEKREHPRESLYYLARYRKESGGGSVISSVNISVGGALLRLREKLEPGEIVELCINFLDHSGRIVCVKAEVIWLRKIKSLYETGVKFISISHEDKLMIEEFIKYVNTHYK